MRIRSDKHLLFRGDNENVTIKNGEIKDLPDWVAKTDTFILAKAEGSILVVDSKADKKNAENNGKLNNETPPADNK